MPVPKSLQHELDRMNATLEAAPTDLQQRQALSDRHVASFAALLRPRVRDALESEGQSLVAGDWVADAERIVRAHLSVPTTASERMAAARMEQAELAKQLRDAAVSISDEDVEEHATELAQLLLSNWFGLLEQAMQDAAEDLIELDMDALPGTAHLDAVLQGCAAFALPALSAATALRQYQRGFMPNSITALSPSLHLVRSSGSWQVARSYERATRALRSAQIAARTSTGDSTVRQRIEAVLDLLRPWALARPVDLMNAAAVPASAVTGVLTNEDEFRLALEAALQLELGAEQDNLTGLADMADLVMIDIADAVAGTSTPGEAWLCERSPLSAMLTDAGVDPGSVYRIALTSAGLMLSEQPLPATPQPAAHSHLEAQILRCSVATAKKALAGSDLAALRRAFLHASASGRVEDLLP